ncbi:MAG: MlaD family protein [Prevotella sp.]
MENKKEIRIAIIAIVGIVLLFFGMQFLKGLSIFSSDSPYLMRFNNITGLSSSSPILANGYRVGTVKSINYDYDHQNEILAEVAIDKRMKIPRGSRAEIVSDMLGNVQVNIILGDNSKDLLVSGDIIDGRLNDGALGDVQAMIPAIQSMLPKLDSILGSVNALLADPALAASLHNVNTITNNLTTSTRELNSLLGYLNKEVPVIAGKANRVMDNAGTMMTTANNTISDAGNLIHNMNGKLEGIDIAGTMDKVNGTMSNVQALTDKINKGEGSLGMLINDVSLYDNLSRTVNDADSLLVNLRQHPKRYVHFSIFGKKDK